MSLSSGHTYYELEGEELKKISDKFPTYEKDGLIRLKPGNWLLPKRYPDYADKIYDFKVKPSDVYIITYMKVGTTWTQEITWTMKYNANLDNPEAELPIFDRSPFLDADMLFPSEFPPEMLKFMEPLMKGFFKHCPGADPREGKHWQVSAAMPEPRFIKCHLPFSMMPPNLLDEAKVIYVARNPRDVICSYYHHCRLFEMMKFTGDLEEFSEYFMNDDLIYSPYSLHVKEAWEKRHHHNMHFMLYEDMKADITKELKKLNDFLGTNLTDQQIENVKHHTSFGEMQKRNNLIGIESNKDNPIFNKEVVKNEGGFFRQGKSGDGKKKLSPETLAKIDQWTERHFNFGLKFP